MPNIEIKARYPDLHRGREVAERYKTQHLGVLRQIDTYFNTAKGRLKLREIPGQGSWLIPYSKTYEKRPARSDYQLLEVKDPEVVKNLFSTLVGTRFVVDKTREVSPEMRERLRITSCSPPISPFPTPLWTAWEWVKTGLKSLYSELIEVLEVNKHEY